MTMVKQSPKGHVATGSLQCVFFFYLDLVVLRTHTLVTVCC